MKKRVVLIFLGLILCSAGFILSAKSPIEDVKENIIRLHIRANSNSKEDQALKLKIRDFIVSGKLLESEELTDKQSVATFIEKNKEDIEEKINREIKRHGFSYNANIRLSTEYFPTKEYENLKLPASRYDALIISLGEGIGENWFCVMFPPVCTSSATKSADALELIRNSCGEEEFKIVTMKEDSKANIKVKFKIIEITEGIKEEFRKMTGI